MRYLIELRTVKEFVSRMARYPIELWSWMEKLRRNVRYLIELRVISGLL